MANFLPSSVKLYEGKRAAFEAWLTGTLGAEILSPTNPWEVLRYRRLTHSSPKSHERTTTVLYRKANGALTWQALVSKDYNRWQNELEVLAAAEKGDTKPNGAKVPTTTVAAVLERDGLDCWLCGTPTDPTAEPNTDHAVSMEHLLSRVHGGSNNAANLCVCHALCNRFLSSHALVQKIELRDEVRRYMRESAVAEFHPKAMDAWNANKAIAAVFGSEK